MAVQARVVANEFIRLAEADGRALTPLQVIKLAYIAHGWMLALYQRPLISDSIEAWKYGPVIPTLYHALKKYGAGSVTGTIGGGFFETKELAALRRAAPWRCWRSRLPGPPTSLGPIAALLPRKFIADLMAQGLRNCRLLLVNL
jgi:antitoxin SocA-like protein